MTTPTWAPGTLYQPGALVIPRSSLPVQTGAIDNPNFASGDTGWTLGTGFSIVAGIPYLPGSSNILQLDGHASVAFNTAQYAVAPGQLINAQCYGWVGTDNSNSMDVRVAFYDVSHTLIQYIAGPTKQGTGNSWQKLQVPAVAPATAAYAAIACAGTSNGSDNVLFSNFTWDYTYAAPADALTYEAVQADAATSAATEPTWPLVAGEEVVDGGVTWEAITFSQIVWTAQSIMTSGDSEPTWPTVIGASVVDNNISWEATTRQVTDPNCPNTETVLIGASKVFAVDTDIVDFCATTNPLDWTTQGDAGYLPTGLQQYGANPNQVLGLYRGNLVAFNSGGYQMWQIDPDPENMALLDAEPIGSTYPKATQAVVNDLMFLTPLGVRSVGISGASANLQAGNVGNQIDPLVVAALATQPDDEEPLGLYYPARGQYWLFFDNGDGTSTAFVMTVYSVSTAQMTAYNTTTQSWSRYVFPEVITNWTLLGDDLYLRTASGLVWKVDEDALLDDVISATTTITAANNDGSSNFLTGYSDGTDVFGQTFGAKSGAPSFGVLNAAYLNGIFSYTVPSSFNVTITGTSALPPQNAFTELTISTDAGPVTLNSADATYSGNAVTKQALWVWNTSTQYWSSPNSYSLSFDNDVTGVPFTGVMQWPWVDMNSLGVEKCLHGFDLVLDGTCSVAVGYDQTDVTTMTDGYEIDGDTLTGQPIPFPVRAPSFSLQLTFDANQAWEWEAAVLYIEDDKGFK